nr:hypothetical protein [Tanacetum cinerariifolium]
THLSDGRFIKTLSDPVALFTLELIEIWNVMELLTWYSTIFRIRPSQIVKNRVATFCGPYKIKTKEGPDDEVMKNKEKLCTRDDKLQTLNHAGSNEKMEAVHEIDCSFDDNKVSDAKIKESGKRDAVVSKNEEGIKWDEDSDERLNEENESVTLENSVASDVVYQVNDNEISQVPRDVQYDIPIKKSKTTLETPHPVKSEKTKHVFSCPTAWKKEAPNDSDENELNENLIEIQLKDIDMKPRIQVVGFNEKVVHENQFQDGNGRKDDHVGLTSHDWEVSDVDHQAVVEKEHKKELKVIEE